VPAASSAEAANRAMEMVRPLMPGNGYHLAEYAVVHRELTATGANSA